MRLARLVNLFIGCTIVIALLMLFVPAFAGDDDCRGNSCNRGDDVDIDIGGDSIDITGGDVSVPVNTEVTGGDVSVEHKSESLGIGLSNSLGDVDIAGCLGSTQWATPLFSKQKLVVNWPCMAEFYLRNGQYELAAMAICNTEIEKEFETEQECEAAHDFRPRERPAPEPTSQVLPLIQGVEIEHDEDIQAVQMAQADLTERVNSIEAILNRPRSTPKPQPVVVEQRPAFTQEQVEAAWMALTKGSKEGEDDE